MSAADGLSLDEIPGLGPVRRQALAAAGIQDLHTLLRTKVAELAAVRGIGVWQARRIHEYLRQHGMTLSEDTEKGVVVLSNARSPKDAQAVAEAMTAMEETAAHEAEVEEEVELLVHALEEARAGATGADGATEGEKAEQGEAEPNEPEAEPAPIEESESDKPGWQEEILSQRERLPESALNLMEAIRQAAVTRQLTRQVTRLLITAGEFATENRELSPGKQRKASQALAQVEQALQRAVEKRAFRPAEQKELAERIRRRRKELEKLLEQAE
jgi:hypothetical protein